MNRIPGTGGAIYTGDVVHNRLHPVRHALRYRVFALLLDVDQLEATGRRLKLFSYNRANILSLHDRDHGDGTPIAGYLRRIAREAGRADDISRFVMLCYPRVFGYVFNPLTVYAGLDGNGETRLVVYEVSNTFGERMTYVLSAGTDGSGSVNQSCRKRFYVSPFNTVAGDYHFRISPIADTLKLAIRLQEAGRTVMTAYFNARRETLNDRNLAAAIAGTGWMTLKVIAGIHIEAARLWLKGLRLTPRPAPPSPAISFDDVPHPETDKA